MVMLILKSLAACVVILGYGCVMRKRRKRLERKHKQEKEDLALYIKVLEAGNKQKLDDILRLTEKYMTIEKAHKVLAVRNAALAGEIRRLWARFKGQEEYQQLLKDLAAEQGNTIAKQSVTILNLRRRWIRNTRLIQKN